MQGGTRPLYEIGLSLLSVVGSVAMGIAVKRLQLDIIKRWAFMKIMPYSNWQNKEWPWIELGEINWPYIPFSEKSAKPFEFLIQYYDGKSELGDFFKDSGQLEKNLLTGNFMLSLLEFSVFIRDPKNKELLLQDNSHEHISPDVKPVWGTMDGHDFVDQIGRLFINVDKILEFCDLKNNNISTYREQFWPLWRGWKQICLIDLGDYARYVPHKMNILTLPGEPIEGM